MYSKSRNATPSAPKISPVTLALQLVSGERLIAEFRPEVSLWDILQHWEANNKLDPSLASLTSDIPVCIYLRKEIASKESLEATTLLELGISNGKAAVRYATKQPGVTEQAHVGGTIAPTPRAPSPEFSRAKQLEKSLAEKMKEEQATAIPVATEEKMVTEESAPVVNEEPEETPEVPQSTESLTQGSQNENVETEQMVCDEEVAQAEPDRSTEGPVHLLNEQGVLVYLPPKDVDSTKRVQEESDEFFELTEEEVRRMMQELIHQNNQLQSAPLITAELRRQQEEKRKLNLLQKYPTTVLRVQFSDSFILQMPLSSEITLAEVKQQLLEYLDVSVKVENFELFTTPPKQVLDTSLPLHEIGLTPSSHVYISSNCALKEQFRLNPSSYTGAVRDAGRRLYRAGTTSKSAECRDTTSPINLDQRPKRQASDAPAAASSTNNGVPKWLKMKR